MLKYFLKLNATLLTEVEDIFNYLIPHQYVCGNALPAFYENIDL